MIGVILNILQSDDFINVSKEIEIAKGKNAIPKNIKELYTQTKRQWRSRKL